MADFAGHSDVGQELHLNLVVAFALAGLATASLDVEGETPWLVTADSCLGERGEQLADRSEGPGVGGRVAAGCPANGRLVDVDDLVDVFDAVNVVMVAGIVPGFIYFLGQPLVKNVVDQGALARTGYAGNAGQHTQRNGNVYALQVVFPCPGDSDVVTIAGSAAVRHGDFLGPAEVLAGQRAYVGHHVIDFAGGHHVPAMFSGAGAEVNDEVCGAHHRLIVLHHNHRIAHVPQAGEGVNESVIVVGMQTHRGLVTNVQDARKAGANLGCQSHPLGLAAGKGPGRTAHGHVVQADAVKETQATVNFLEYLVGDGLVPRGQHLIRMLSGGIRVYGSYPLDALGNIHGGNFHDAQVANLDSQGLRLETLALAGLARAGGHVPLNVLAGVVGFGLPVPAFQVGYDTFKPGFPTVGPAVVGAVPDGNFLAFDPVENNLQVLLVQIFDRNLWRKVVGAGHRLHHAHVPARGRSGAVPGYHRSFQQREIPVGNDQVGVHFQLEAKAGALGAGAVGAVEAEGARLDFGQAGAAADTGKLLGIDKLFFLGALFPGLPQDLQDAFTFPEGSFD